MIVLDTSVLAELMRPAADEAVVRWLDLQPEASVFVAAVTEAELRHQVTLVAGARRRGALAAMVEAMLEEAFLGRVLPFDAAAAASFAAIMAERRAAGRRIAQADAQVAAVARSRGAALAARNVWDFEGCGVVVVDPWGG